MGEQTEAQREAAQKEAGKKLAAEQKARLLAQATNKGKEAPKGKDVCAYSRPTDYPDITTKKNCIQVDTRNEVRVRVRARSERARKSQDEWHGHALSFVWGPSAQVSDPCPLQVIFIPAHCR